MLLSDHIIENIVATGIGDSENILRLHEKKIYGGFNIVLHCCNLLPLMSLPH